MVYQVLSDEEVSQWTELSELIGKEQINYKQFLKNFFVDAQCRTFFGNSLKEHQQTIEIYHKFLRNNGALYRRTSKMHNISHYFDNQMFDKLRHLYINRHTFRFVQEIKQCKLDFINCYYSNYNFENVECNDTGSVIPIVSKFSQIWRKYCGVCNQAHIEHELSQQQGKQQQQEQQQEQEPQLKVENERKEEHKCEIDLDFVDFVFVQEICDNQGTKNYYQLPNMDLNNNIIFPSAINVYDNNLDIKKYQMESKNIQNENSDSNENGNENENKQGQTDENAKITKDHIIDVPDAPVSEDKLIEDLLFPEIDDASGGDVDADGFNDIDVVASDTVFCDLMDLDDDFRWKESFCIPFTVVYDARTGKNILLIDDAMPKNEWSHRYCNEMYFENVFKSYLSMLYINNVEYNNTVGNIMQNAMSADDTAYLENNVENAIGQKIYNINYNGYSIYSLFEFRKQSQNGGDDGDDDISPNLKCLIRSKIEGLTPDNQFIHPVLQLDYINTKKQMFDEHLKRTKHEINQLRRIDGHSDIDIDIDINDKNVEKQFLYCLSDIETGYAGCNNVGINNENLKHIEKMTQSRRIKNYLKCFLRNNSCNLILARMKIPNNKLVSCKMVEQNKNDCKILLTDKNENLNLNSKLFASYQIVYRLFNYLLHNLKIVKSQNENISNNDNSNESDMITKKRFVFVYKRETDKIGIFGETQASNDDNSNNNDGNGNTGNNVNAFNLGDYAEQFTCQRDIDTIEFIEPYSVRYRGAAHCHVASMFPPSEKQFPKVCPMFNYYGFCPKQQEYVLKSRNLKRAQNCAHLHYRTHVFTSCWEYAWNGQCDREQCEYVHLTQEELIEQGKHCFHIKQLIDYCQDYCKYGQCQSRLNTESGRGGINTMGISKKSQCFFIHLSESELKKRFNLLKDSHLNDSQLITKGYKMQKQLFNNRQGKNKGKKKKQNLHSRIRNRTN